jgi:hypothetical protein
VVGAQTLGLVQSVRLVCAYGLLHHQVSHAQFCIIAVKSENKVIFAVLSASLTLSRLLPYNNTLTNYVRTLHLRVDSLLFLQILGSQK